MANNSPCRETEELWLRLFNQVEQQIGREVAWQATRIATNEWNTLNQPNWEGPYQTGIAWMRDQLGICPPTILDGSEYEDILQGQEIYRDLQEGR